ncbi:MAG: Lipoprotein-releasing system ATP-binding protein LolD [bacterium ADurb.Bin429]|nr:MAG: Lipoprotein-releasing system ATP-binding protein LolD [bacterium ADurb.Bin429]
MTEPAFDVQLSLVAEAAGMGKIYRRGAEEIHALREISVAFAPGEFTCVLGPSGAGKTTLLNLLGVMDVPTSGALRVAGTTIADAGRVRLAEGGRDRLRRENIGFIFTEFFLLPTLTAVENVQLPLLWAEKDDHSYAVELLERVGLGHRLTHRPTEMSGGEMQRVAIARALINRPRLLLADEPTGNVDTKTRDGIFDLFRELNADGLTIVLATHDGELAARIDRVIHLREGRIVEGA